MAINQKKFVRLLAERENIQIKDSERILASTLDIITESLQKGETVSFAGFGKFKPHKKKAHEGTNPRTNEKMWIDEICVPVFTAGKVFKDAVSNAYKSSK